MAGISVEVAEHTTFDRPPQHPSLE